MSDFNIKEVNGKIICVDDFAGINTNDLIANGNGIGTLTYTAIKDCFVYVKSTDAWGGWTITIDNVEVALANSDGANYNYLLRLKKGQVLKILHFSQNYSVSYFVYGLKY